MDPYEITLSEYGSLSSAPSPVNRMMASFADDFREGVDINVGVGYVNERTIPRNLILGAMREVMDDPERYRFAFNYGGSRGSDNLIESIRRFHIENDIGGLTCGILDKCGVIIGANGATSILEGIARILPPGIVITSDPMYYIYCNFLERCGFRVLTVPEDGDGMRIDLLEEQLRVLGKDRSDISFIYIVTVNNPSCTILSNDRREAVVGIAHDLSRELGRLVPVFFDKAYENLVHDTTVPQMKSGLLYDEDGIVYEIGTMSKILAPALRIGYMIGPDGPFMSAMIQRTNDAGFSAPLIAQEIASRLLDCHVSEQIASVNEGYRAKSLIVGDRIRSMLGDYLENLSGGKAGFYYYLTFRDTLTTEGSPFFRYLTRTTGDIAVDGPQDDKRPRDDRQPRVIYVPGEFCVHPKGSLVETGKRQLRLSYGFEETEPICTAVGIMKEAVDNVRHL